MAVILYRPSNRYREPTMLLPSAFHSPRPVHRQAPAPPAARPGQGPGPVGGRHDPGPQRLPERGPGRSAEPGFRLARHPPVPAGVALRRGRPGRALRGAAGRAGLFRAPPALGPGLVAGLRTDAGRRPHGQGRGAGGPGGQRGLPRPDHPRGLAHPRPAANPAPGCPTSVPCSTGWAPPCRRT